jgi:anthranilate phosphoribosyltransferase
MKTALESLLAGRSLSCEQSAELLQKMLDHAAAPQARTEPIAAVLIALRMKTESADELLGFVQGMSRLAVPVALEEPELLDVCGTGGDRSGTFNVSTGVALILASCGIRIAKHGNRGVSSQSGSADVLEALGLRSDRSAAEAAESLGRHGLTFLFAPAFHPALAALAPIRKSLGTSTIFNALGPLLNPAPITRQLIGVYHRDLMPKMIHVARARGLKEACVVHGSDGLDEVTLSGETEVAFLSGGEVRQEVLTPELFGLKRARIQDLRAGSPAESAAILTSVFQGERSPRRDVLVINAALGLVVAGVEQDYKSAARRVEQVLDSGATLTLLQQIQGRAQ